MAWREAVRRGLLVGVLTLTVTAVQSAEMWGDAPDLTRLTIPNGTDDARFRELFAARNDWTVIVCEAPVRDDWLEAIAACPTVTYVALRNGNQNQLGANGLAALGRLSKLRVLDAWYMKHEQANDVVLSALAKGCPELEELSLFTGNIGGITDRTLQELAAGCPALTRLRLCVSPEVGDVGISALARGLKRLHSFSLIGSANVTAAGLEAFGDDSTLTKLELGLSAAGGNEIMETLVRVAPRLTELAFYNGASAITDDGFARLASLKQLQEIRFHETSNITDRGLAALGDLRSLREVRVLDARAITDAGLAALAELPALTDIMLAYAEGITDAGVENLVLKRRDLTTFRCWTSPITARGLAAFSGLPRLSYLELGGGRTEEEARQFEEEALRFRQENPNVHLTIITERWQQAMFGVEDQLRQAARQVGADPQRTLLVPRGANRDMMDKLLAGKTDWEAIYCASVLMDDPWVTRLADCPDLVAFSNHNVNPAGLSSAGMARFAVFPKLKVFHICSANTLADADFARVLEHCPDLEDVRVCDSGPPDVGAASLAALAQCAELRRLHLRGIAPNAGDAFLDVFAARLPNLELLVVESGAGFTPERVAAFRRARPKVQFRVPVAAPPAAVDAPPFEEEVF